MQNHFDLFGLTPAFALDMVALDMAYRQVQSSVHPDRFAQSSPAEKRLAMQWATRANEAYQTLKQPIQRAIYLCNLHGVDVEAESNTSMPVTFLLQQMNWREELDVAKTELAALEALDHEVRQHKTERLLRLGTLIDQAADYAGATQLVRELMFIEKFAHEVDDAIDQLEQSSSHS